MHARHLRMLAQKFGNAQRVLVLALDPHRERLDSAQQQKRRMWIHACSRASCEHDESGRSNRAVQPRCRRSGPHVRRNISCPNAARDRCPISAGRQLMGVAKVRVNHRDQVVLPAPMAAIFFEIDDAHRRIGRRLDVQKFCVGTNRALVLLDVVGIDERGFDRQASAATAKETWSRRRKYRAAQRCDRPLLTSARIDVVIAAMPEENRSAASVPSSSAIADSATVCVGIAVARVETSRCESRAPAPACQ